MIEIPASHADLIGKNQAVALATLGPDGFPQVTAVWFLHDEDGLIKMSLHPARQKTKNLLRHPECSLFFDDPGNPYRTLEIRARAELVPDPEYVFADRVSAKYGGNSLRAMDAPGDVRYTVSFVPVKTHTFGQ